MKNPTIHSLPPSLGGLTWRPITRDDLGELVDLGRTCFRSDGGLFFLFEPEEIASTFFPDERGSIIGAFNSAGQLVACHAVILSDDANPPQVTMIGHVHPDLRARGLGTYLMRWGHAQGESLLGGTAGQWVLQIRTESLTEAARRLYEAHGFRPKMEELVMRCDLDQRLPDCAFPPDVTVSDWQPDLAELFFQAYHAAFRERPGFPGFQSAVEWVDHWMDEHFRPDWSILARTGNTALGFLTAADDPPHGFIMQVGVIPPQRRRGLASALAIEAMRRMQAAGALSAQLTVNVNNPGAIQAYARLGFVTIGRRARYERSVENVID